MKAYLNNPELKQSVLAEMAGHRAADNLVKGQYWEDGKGCAVGCLLKNGNHEEYEDKFGIPAQLARLEDSIFEGLPNDQAMLWPERFLSAFEVGKDYSKVWNHFAVWMLIDPEVGVIRYADERGKIAIINVAKLHQQEIDGTAARAAARAAARDAAGAAARAAAWDAAGDAAYMRMADKLIEIIEGVK